jgi:hypothetical protein
MKLAILLAAASLAFVAAPASAAFRCTAKDGKTVYMERPCSTYGYATAKEVKDPPKGDGTASVLKPGQAIIGTTPKDGADGGRVATMRVPLQCQGERVMCTPGEMVMCGGKKQSCESS